MLKLRYCCQNSYSTYLICQQHRQNFPVLEKASCNLIHYSTLMKEKITLNYPSTCENKAIERDWDVRFLQHFRSVLSVCFC